MTVICYDKADKQATVSLPKEHAGSLISKPQISGEGSHSKADKQAAVSLPKKQAVSLISKPQISGAGSHSKADKVATISQVYKRLCSGQPHPPAPLIADCQRVMPSQGQIVFAGDFRPEPAWGRAAQCHGE